MMSSAALSKRYNAIRTPGILFELSARDTDLDNLNWTATGLPPGMFIDTQAGVSGSGSSSFVLRWTPDYYAAQSSSTGLQPGHYSFTVKASDGAAEVLHTFEVTVANTNQAPKILPLPLQLVNEGDTVNFTVLAADPDGTPVNLGLLHDATTPVGVSFDPNTGYFEWTPGQDIVNNPVLSGVEGATANDTPYTFTFSANDGIATTIRTVQVRVFDVNRPPQLQVSNHAIVIGQSLSLPVIRGQMTENGGQTAGIVVSDLDGNAQTAALAISFVGLPDGATYDAQTMHLNWTPGPGQVGDFTITAQASDGKNITSQSFVLRVVADVAANAPKVLISTTPSTPAQPGQTLVATIRAQSYSAIQTLAVQVRGAALSSVLSPQSSDTWQTVALDSAGRLHLTPTQPGLLEIQVTAIDQDGFSTTQTHIVRVKDITDTSAPLLAWGGALFGATSLSQPVTVSSTTALQAALQERQLMGYKLEIAPAGTSNWSALTEQTYTAENISTTLTLSSVISSLSSGLHNGVYSLRLSAWDLVGRTSEIDARIVIDTAQKNITTQSATDQIYTLGGHNFALTRTLEATPSLNPSPDGRGTASPSPAGDDFGNWTIPALDTHLTTDQTTSDSTGAVAPWQADARVWLQVPSSLGDANAAMQNLSFTLSITQEKLGNTAGAPVVFHPVFATSQGWTLQAHGSGSDSASPGSLQRPDSLQRIGSNLFDNNTGLPWVPVSYTLSAADGTRYQLDTSGKITAVIYTDGAQWLISNAGIAAVTTDNTVQRIDFLRDSSTGSIVRITGPVASNSGTEQNTIVYKYDTQGRLILARNLSSVLSSQSSDLGKPYGYDANGLPYADTITANFGAAVNWNSSATANQWQGNLQTGSTTTLAFTVRDSEITSTVHAPGAQGAVIVAVQTSGTTSLEITGGTILSSVISPLSSDRTTLVRINEAGLKLLRLSGSGATQVKVSLAGDINRDGFVNGVDSAVWEAMLAAGNIAGDINGDGLVNATDRQVLYANYGLRANQAPVAASVLPAVHTHTDLATSVALNTVAQDLEGDTIFWRLLGSTHVTAKLSSDGLTLLFTPEAGYAGTATITVQADDGYASSAPIALSVNVSGAQLLALHLVPLATLSTGQSAVLHATADFADEQGVAITDPNYLTVSNALTLPPLQGEGWGGDGVTIDDTRDLLIARAQGPALIIITRTDGGHTVQAVDSLNMQLPADPNATDSTDTLQVQPDVYPGTLTLIPNGTRQLKVHLLDPQGSVNGTGAQTDVHTTSQTSAITTLNAQGQPVLDASGQPVTTPVITDVTRYYSSDDSIASVDANGLITAHVVGRVTISVVHLETPVITDYLTGTNSTTGQPTYTPIYKMGTASIIGQSDIALNVQVAQLTDNDAATPAPQAITVSAQDGAAISAVTGERVLIGPGALTQDSAVSISRIDINNLQAATGMAAPVPNVLQTIGAFHLDLGAGQANVPVQFSISLQDNAGVQAGDEVMFMRRGQAPDVNGVMQDTWWILDNGFVSADANGQLVAKTASIPYYGVTASGNYIVVRSVSTNTSTGSVTVTGAGVNLYGVMVGSVALALRGGFSGGVGGLSAAMGAMLITSSISVPMYAINQTFDGAYVTQPINKTTDSSGNTILDFTSNSTNGNNTQLNQTSPQVIGMQIVDGKLQLTLSQAFQPNAEGQIEPTKLRIFISPDQLLIDSKGNASSALWSGNTCAQNGILMWEQLAEINVGSTDTGAPIIATLDIPDNIALSLHNITVQRMVQRTVDPANDIQQWFTSGTQTSVAMQGRSDISVVTTAQHIDVMMNGSVIKEINYADYVGKVADLTALVNGYKTDQLAFSEDNRLLFVAGTKGHIAIVDTATLSIVDYLQVDGSSDNIASLAVAGDYLYVAEGGRYTAGNGMHRLMRVNIDATSKDFLKSQQIILPASVSGATNTPYGYFDLAVLKGTHNYLAVTASKSNLPLMGRGEGQPLGEVFVLDLNALVVNGANLSVPDSAFKLVGGIVDNANGKGPQYITPATIKTDSKGNPVSARFLLSNALDYKNGLDAVDIPLNADGSFGGDANINYIKMSLTSSLSVNVTQALANKYQLDIQRAQGTVFYTVTDPVTKVKTEYALVADYYMDFNEPGWADGSTIGKQIGGKVGIIKDPFGTAEYLGSTTPILNASIKDLSLSPDGNSLMGNISSWAQTGDTNPPKSGILVWNLAALIKAANDNSLKVQNTIRPIPFDRTGNSFVNTPVSGTTPTKLDFGWVFGMASNVTAPVLHAGNANYGDIARVDIIKAIADTYVNATCPLITGFNIDNIQIEPESQQYAKLVTYTQGGVTKLISGAQDPTLTAVSGASAASYKGNFNSEGVFFLSPQFTDEEMQTLRAGGRLPDRIIKIRVNGLTVGDKADQSYVIEINLKDFTDAAGRVFFGDRPTNDPGYSAFTLSGDVSENSLATRPDKAAAELDIWRVEQRLKYLAFPAMGASNDLGAPSRANNVIQDFKVDGAFGEREQRALKLFEKVVRYGYQNRDFPDNSNGADGMIEASGAQADKTEQWLNAYNAPHWMLLFGSSINGWVNKQTGSSSPMNDTRENFNTWLNRTAAVENYGTSWVHDLMAATQYAPDALRGDPILNAQGNVTGYTPRNTFWFNGATDANYGATPSWWTDANGIQGIHQTHDLGMAFDLGVTGYIAQKGAQVRSEQLLPAVITAINDVVVPWSLDAALNYSAQLFNGIDVNGLADYQALALRDFMSLYAVTQSNTWGAMSAHVVNGLPARDALFGTGTQAGGMISDVVIGGTGSQNPYPNMRKVLSGLGINNYNAAGHNSHFHVFLKPPTPKDLPKNLVAGDPAATDSTATNATPQTEAQELLDYTQTLITGDELMFTMDVPAVPAQQTPIVLAQSATPAAESTPQFNFILKDCQETESSGGQTIGFNTLSPSAMLYNYFLSQGRTIDSAGIKADLLEEPSHGKLSNFVTGKSYTYDPIPNYVGNDKAVFLAEFDGKRYKIVVELHVFETVFENDQGISSCPPPELIKVNRKPVSGALGADINVGVMDSLTVDAANITVTFGDLPGGAVGQTTGGSITLDNNAAGNGWFIDTTPADNSEFLPTSNSNEWVAKAGSAAFGKMDMLSVLLHEYGHALGIEHSADSGDYMSAILTPGMRRLPSATELALMQNLIAQAKGIAQAKDGLASTTTSTLPLQGGGGLPLDLPISLGGLAFAGLLRPNRFGGMNIDLVSAITPAPVPRPQYEVSANATFTSLNTASGWNTQGSVDIVSSTGTGQTGTATLNEVSTSQTRLSQIFMLGDRDRYLSFTLSGAVLDHPTGAPEDAFEVALLDANKGLSVLGNDGLTRTDAFLNLQGDGTQNAASCVTCIVNADGSRTYRVDLTGVTKNTAVNLSFDLLGFGANNSNVTLRDIRVSGLPQLHDEVASIAEDNLLTFNPFAQADAQLQPLLASHIVTTPTHGVLAMNANGTFSYTPTLNFFGADSFSYRLSDGPLDSNLATVSLTVTPVNDAPVAADAQVTTAEDTPLVIALGAYASDVDTPSLSGGGLGVGVGLTTAIVTGPAHGVLTQNADGTYNYTPIANYNGADGFTYKVNDGHSTLDNGDSNIATVS